MTTQLTTPYAEPVSGPMTETTWYDESAGFDELDGFGPDDDDEDDLDEDDDYRD